MSNDDGDRDEVDEPDNVVEVSFRPAATLDELNESLHSLHRDIASLRATLQAYADETSRTVRYLKAAAELEARVAALEERLK